ncbi:MAG TPA: HD domain-containing protein [Solirubrobacteraceae bacterium]|jgi:3'-5' exoribonuclease|nr:HD domain-containing protein [Solirubrobacteraceae bacterium]
MVVRELTDGQELDCVLLVRERRLRTERDGSEILQLTLGDRTGSIAAVVSDGVADLSAACDCGAAVRVQGRYSSRGERIAIRSLRAARADEVDLDALLDGPPRGAEQMEADMRALIGTVQSVHLRALLEAVLGAGSDSWGRFRDAPAAKRYHQAYRHGLLEHSLSVAQSVSAIAANFPGIDRDVAVCGALLHDIGKLDAYTADPLAIDMTDAGKLQGEIPLGYYRVRRLIEDLPGFPDDLAAAVLHIILSHHGALEHGSPVVPCTREATLVHMIDNLGGRLGSFDRLEKELPEGSRWSGYDRALGGGAYFGARAAA